jgi:hypothetical protein
VNPLLKEVIKEARENKIMIRPNCWEIKKCGREPGGAKVDELGVCPVATEKRLDGTHGGKNAGRVCWVVAGSMCGGKIQGTYAEKYMDCIKCDFYMKVKMEENAKFKMTAPLVEKLRNN